MIARLRDAVSLMLTTPGQDLLDVLGQQPSAQQYQSSKPDGWAYMPGTLPPEERVLLVAHVDTVGHALPELYWQGNIVTNLYGVLGADDRAGVALTWLMRDTGHSVLWTDGEESGGLGAICAGGVIPEELSQHAYMVEVDRAGDQEYALYRECSSAPWEEWLREQLPGWDAQWGSFTDITFLGPMLGLCGVNLAAGYLYQHTHKELLVLDALARTYARLEELVENVPWEPMRPDPRSPYLRGDDGLPWWLRGAPMDDQLTWRVDPSEDEELLRHGTDEDAFGDDDDDPWDDAGGWNAAGDRVPV